MLPATNSPCYPLQVCPGGVNRALNRAVGSRRVYWLTVLMMSFTASIVASGRLNGKEIDFRFVDLAGHMQLWPIEETDEATEIPPLAFRPAPTQASAPLPNEPTPIDPVQTWANPMTSGADDWRKTLTAQREASRTLDPSKQQGKLPDSALPIVRGNIVNRSTAERGDVVERGDVELLVVPKTPTRGSQRGPRPTADQPSSPARPLPSSRPRDCYHAPPLSALSVSIGLPAGKLPTNAAAECASQIVPTGDSRLAGAWAGTELHWSATCLRHRPLYIEEINAERYGYTASAFLQPVISAAHFFATIPALPYKMAVDRPRDCIYTLGHDRPGSCAPRRWNRLPWQLTAGVVEAGFVAAMILLIP